MAHFYLFYLVSHRQLRIPKRLAMNNLKHILFFTLAGFICCCTFSQKKADTVSLRRSIEIYPDSLALHKAYIATFYSQSRDAFDSAHKPAYTDILKQLSLQYNQWTKMFPAAYMVPFAIGDAFCKAELPEAKVYLQKTVEINPKYAPAWMDLWEDAERWGDFKKGQEYIGRAAAAQPDNPDYAFYYAFGFRNDTAEWIKRSYDLTKRFPKSERGAQALYWVGVSSTDDATKMEAFDHLKKLYPPDKYKRWSQAGMEAYFDFLLVKHNWDKAASLSAYMYSLDSLGDTKDVWENNKILSAKLIAIEGLLKDKKQDSAYLIAKTLMVSKWYASYEIIQLLKVETIALTGNTAAAYDSLVAYYAKSPKNIFQEKLSLYGKALGKSQETIHKDIWAKRMQLARPAEPFTLAGYLKDDSLSLSALKGKIVLLTFWFPGCGPCRGEFPHFELVLKKFNGDRIAYIGINVEPEQDQYVVPFMRQSGYSFIPLHASWNWARKNYNVRGAPSNFLIDRSGRIIYSDFMISDADKEAELEIMIRSLLNDNKTD